MKKVFIIILAILLAVGGYIYLHKDQKAAVLTQHIVNTTTSSKSTANSLTPSTPIKIVIPSLGINSDIESVGLDAQDRMDVPQNPANAGWYNLGYKPGEIGSAVIDGHVDTPTGAPAIFYKLANLNEGDTIEIFDASNEKYTFKVDRSVAYDFDKVPLQEVFASSDAKRLNLITCDGTWDKANKNYTKRRVIYARIID